jgi:hypothetical protein
VLEHLEPALRSLRVSDDAAQSSSSMRCAIPSDLPEGSGPSAGVSARTTHFTTANSFVVSAMGRSSPVTNEP